MSNLVELSTLAAKATTEYRLASGAAVSAVEHAIACGEALLQAQAGVPDGKWGKWCAENVPEINFTTVTKFCRLAAHKDQIAAGEFTTIDRAMNYLHQLAIPARPTGPKRRVAKIDVGEARKLRDLGMSYVDIGDVLGVSHQCVALHLDPERRKRKKANERRRAQELRAAREALAARQRDQAVRKTGGLPADAYALLRKCALTIDKAIGATEDSAERTKLTAALGYVHKAEDEIVRALRLEREVTPRRVLPRRRLAEG